MKCSDKDNLWSRKSLERCIITFDTRYGKEVLAMRFYL